MVILDEVGGRLSVRMADTPADTRQDVPHAMYLSPPHTPLRASANGLRYVRQLSLQFDYEALETLFHGGAPPISAGPKLGFFDPQIYALARVFEAACGGGADDYDDLLGDSPAFSVLSLLSNHSGDEPASLTGGGLTPPQLRRVTDYLQDHLADPVRPVELAKLVGMSRSRFCRAFKISTGLPPHAWLVSLRVRRARELMMSGGHALVDVALGTGFADQPHFTRVFMRFSGVTPGEWRRQWCA
jgi:AraC family transcriptional regulator